MAGAGWLFLKCRQLSEKARRRAKNKRRLFLLWVRKKPSPK